MSIISPFKFGRVVTGDSFINRKDEKSRIRSNILSRNNTIIISPRRWGKSSLMRQLASEMESGKIKFVFLDIYNIRTEEDFFTAYSREIIKATITRKEEVLNTAKKFFKKIVPVISFKIDPLHDLSLKFNWEEAKEAIDEMIDLPEKIAKDKGLKIIVCIDEFQNIARLRDYEKLEETLRSYWQLHEQVSYCLYGSKRHMMVDIFNRESRPLYRFGDIIMLGKIKEEHWIDFIISGFKDSGKSIPPDLAGILISTAGNLPEYVQQLAHHTWSLTETMADEHILNYAIEMVRNSNSIFYQEICDDLSNTQLNLIKAVFQGETQFTSAEVMKKYNLGTPRNVSKNKEILEAKDIVDFSAEPVQFNDPFFKTWFQMTFY
jgi:hypothetical protein